MPTDGSPITCPLFLCNCQIGAFLMGLKMYGEQPFMVAACTKVMREHSLKCPLEDVTDIVGTGGDGHDTFNVSTAAAIVAAACGLRVAKARSLWAFVSPSSVDFRSPLLQHGNRASSSACGSADILEAAGANLDLDPPEVKEIIDACGFWLVALVLVPVSLSH
jgi:anthranilate phosphoribosyltransferase